MHPPNEVKVIPVVRVKCTRGDGTEEDLSRFVNEYWSLDGDFLADDDTFETADSYRPLRRDCLLSDI